MTPPAASSAMLFLASLAVGVPHRAAGGELWVDVPGAGPQPVPAADLDWLESQGWLTLDGERPEITPTGRYWLERWAYKHHRPRR